MSEGKGNCGGKCGDCKRVREHVASLLPFRVLEAAAGKPLRISGVALAVGMSRNFNVYTVEELQAFAEKLVNSPMYIEHVAVPNAMGKVTKAFYDSVSKCLMYEAEVYDPTIADKIRNGLIQHVSVGADYDALDLVDAKVPRGLHNAELSLVAVPGVPEANIQVLERLRESFAHSNSSKLKISAKEILDPLNSASLACVFCGAPGEYLVSVCTPCGDKANAATQAATEFFLGFDPGKGKDFSALVLVEKVGDQVIFREQVDPLVAGEYFLGFYQDPALFLPEHFRTVWLDQANGVLAVMAKTRADPAKELCQSILFLKSKWQPNTVADWLVIHPDYSVPASGSASQAVQSGVENLGKERKWENKSLEGRVRFLETLRHLNEQTPSKEEVEAKLGALTQERDALYTELEGIDAAIQQASDAERENTAARRGEINGKLDLLWAEISAYQDVLAKVIAAGAGEGGGEGEGAAEKLAAAEKMLGETKAKLSESEGTLKTTKEQLDDTTSKLGAAEKTIEDLRKQVPGGGLLKDPPKMIPVSEAMALIEGVLPVPMVQRAWGLGPQRMCQDLRRVVQKLEAR